MEKFGSWDLGNFASRRRQVAPPAEDGRSFKFNQQLGMETQGSPKEHGCKVSLFQLSISSMVHFHDCHQIVYRALTALFSSGLNCIQAQGLAQHIVHGHYGCIVEHMVQQHCY